MRTTLQTIKSNNSGTVCCYQRGFRDPLIRTASGCVCAQCSVSSQVSHHVVSSVAALRMAQVEEYRPMDAVFPDLQEAEVPLGAARRPSRYVAVST